MLAENRRTTGRKKSGQQAGKKERKKSGKQTKKDRKSINAVMNMTYSCHVKAGIIHIKITSETSEIARRIAKRYEGELE